MTAAGAPVPAAPVPTAAATRPPWARAFPLADPRALLATVHVTTDLWMGIVTATTVVVLLSLAVGLVPTLLFAVPAAWLLVTVSRLLARLERARAAAFLGVRVADPYRPPAGRWWERIWRRVRSGVTWREIAYHLLLLPLGSVGASLVLAAWSGSLFCLALPFVVTHLPDATAHFWLFDLRGGARWWFVPLGVAGVVWVAPWVALGWGALDAALVRTLLGPGRHAAELTQLSERVETLTTTRALAVDAAEQERRRIERDLHDGAQQRLVALALELGMARSKFDTDPDAARALLDEAHEDAKAAIAELRDVARGIHPVALTDRGLPGAIPGLADRSPVPVEVLVDVPERPVPAVEGIAYFVVSEALTNVAKHSGATRARVEVVRRGDRLSVEVRDDGRGGVDPADGSGLRGLAQRVAAVDGRMTVDSPVGGPTVVRAELPCTLAPPPARPPAAGADDETGGRP